MRLLSCWLLVAASLAHAQAVLVDRIVATVDNRAITRSMVDARLKQGAKDRADARDLLIEETLIALDCDRARIDVEPAEVDRALGEIAKTNNLTDAELLEALQQQGYELQSYRAALRTQLLSMRWLMRQTNGAPLPTEPAERARFLDFARTRALDALRKRTSVEVREVQP
jgi:peptidyl-prolyl cis-trans isomerase SurA